ncbi:MAG: S1 RNA-binding domain-containing protein [bacterium]
MTKESSKMSFSELIDKKSEEPDTDIEVSGDGTMGDLLESSTISIPQLGDTVEGIILDISKNAIYVDLGPYGVGVVRGQELFESIDMYDDLKVGDKLSANVVDYENENGNIELSFKQISKQQAWEDLAKKMDDKEVLSVKINEANKGGLLTIISGLPAFLPVSQLTPEHYPRVEGGNQDEILTRLKSYMGTKFKVRIIGVDPGEEKLIISEKAAHAEEHKERLKDFKVGQVVKGRVSGIVDFGVFIKFDDDLEGLVHISELAWQRIDDPGDIVKVGQKVDAEIISIDNEKISLSMKKLVKDPWQEAMKHYKVGQDVEGEIIKITPFGAFVQLDNEIHGLAHISELAGKKDVNPKDIFSIGEKKKFRIISIDPDNHRLGLTLKDSKSTESKLEVKKAKKE